MITMCVVAHGALLLLLATAVAEDGPSSIINEVSKNLGTVMMHCVDVLYPNTGYFKEVLDFWNKDMNIRGHFYLGCVAACSLFKLRIRNRDGSLNEPNLNTFLRNSGADEESALDLLNVFRACQNQSSAERKPCMAGFSTMICFRSHIYRLNWTPEFYKGAYENVLNGK